MNVSNTQSELKLKIFVGFLVTSELKMYLNHSIEWKHAKIQKNQELEEVNFHQKAYIGTYINDKQLKIGQIHRYETSLRQKISIYCQAPVVEHLPICIFPQVFIA